MRHGRTAPLAGDTRSVAICVCTRDRPDELAQTLASIASSARPVQRVIVSDDGVNPRTPEIGL
jgi:glycosyltransferase involved in cell wall biosynthesis